MRNSASGSQSGATSGLGSIPAVSRVSERPALLLPSEPLEALRMFRERLGFALMRAGVAFRQGGFNPHVTLLYGGQPMPEIEIEPISWLVEDFVLIDSFIGETKHVEIGRWPLRS